MRATTRHTLKKVGGVDKSGENTLPPYPPDFGSYWDNGVRVVFSKCGGIFRAISPK